MEDWIKSLFNCHREDCPYHQDFNAMKGEGVYPRGMAGCTSKPKVVLVGLQPGPIGPAESWLYKELIIEENPMKMLEFYNYMFFEYNRNLHAHVSPYVDSLRDLFEQLSDYGEPKSFVYHTDLVKCQKEWPGGDRWLKEATLKCCYNRFFKEEMDIVLGNSKEKPAYMLLGGKVRDFFEKMGKNDPLAGTIWNRSVKIKHPGRIRWKQEEIQKLEQEIRKRIENFNGGTPSEV